MSGFLTRGGGGRGEGGGWKLCEAAWSCHSWCAVERIRRRPPASIRKSKQPVEKSGFAHSGSGSGTGTGHRTQEQGCKLEKEGVRRGIAFCCT